MMGSGTVYGIDHIEPLVEQAKANVHKIEPDLVPQGKIVFLTKDGRKGLPEYAPYDCIHVGAGTF